MGGWDVVGRMLCGRPAYKSRATGFWKNLDDGGMDYAIAIFALSCRKTIASPDKLRADKLSCLQVARRLLSMCA